MNKKRIFALIILSLSLCILIPAIAQALNAPTNATVDCQDYGSGGECIVNQISARLLWTWAPGGNGTIKQFKILYRDQTSPIWTPAYPDPNDSRISGDNFKYDLAGLVPGGTLYEWRIKAEAVNSSYDSPYTPGANFYTATSGGGGNGDGDGNGDGNGGWTPPIIVDLKNPLDADTFEDAINALIDILFVLAFTIAPVLLIYAGFLILFKSDDPHERNKARNIIFWVLIALAIIVLAKALPAIVKSALSS